MDASLTDDEVVARVRAGEPALFEIVMRRYNQRLFRVARAIVADDGEAEDAVQEGWVAAYAHLGQFAGEARFSTWLTRIVINEALGRRRKRRQLAELDFDAPEKEETMRRLPATDRDPEAQVAGRELTALVERALDTLPEGYRLVFMMRDVQQLSTAETAAVLEMTEDVVKVRLHRARGMLRERLYASVDRAAPEAFAFQGARCDRLVRAVMARVAPSGGTMDGCVDR